MVEDTMFSGESKNIEYKVFLPDKSEKYMKTIVAFANTQGGKLIVGVDDKTHQIIFHSPKHNVRYSREQIVQYFWIRESLQVRFIHKSRKQ